MKKQPSAYTGRRELLLKKCLIKGDKKKKKTILLVCG